MLGGFTVGDGARIGSNAVVVKPVPAGATAVGNPARLIEAAPQTTDAAAAHVQEPVAQSAQGTHSVQTTHNAQTMHVASATNTAQTTQTAEDRHSSEKQSTSTPLSPCDAGWDAAPLKALLDKGASPANPPTLGESPNDSASFTAYAVDPGASDPLVKVLHELINHAAAQDARIAQLCQTIEAMGSQVKGHTAPLDAQRLNKLVDE